MYKVETRCDNTPVKADFKTSEKALPSHASVVIVGGGVAGASVAYHLAQAGWRDVCLIEQNSLSSGTTWHSAGQVGQLRSSSAQTKINKESADLYARLEAETGHDPGWLRCGGLQLAASEERLLQLRRHAAVAEVFGVEANVVSAKECQEFWPMLNIDDLCGAVYLPGDGRVLPGECTIALVKGAIQGGVSVIEGISARRLLYSESPRGIKRFYGLETDQGEIRAEWIVLACNMWMRQLGLTAGVNIPVYPCEHHYVITRPMDGVTRDSPCTRDPDAGLYFRALDDGGMKLGAFKKRSKPWNIGDRVPSDFAFSLLEPDWPDFAEPFLAHKHRLRGLRDDDVVKFVNGPEAFTPDNNFLMGQPYLSEGLFVCGGWNSAGIACAGGAGKFAVEWMENGAMTLDLLAVDIQRFHPFHNDRKFLRERVSEVLGLHYQMAWPGRQMETGRNRRSSALFEQHTRSNACFGESAGWERPLFYAPRKEDAHIDYSFVRQNWHDWVAEEVAACRQNVGLLDQSTFGKFQLIGSDALELLQRLCSANVDCPVGQAVHTSMFNQAGKYEADLIVARIGSDAFYLVTSTNQQLKDFDWLVRNTPDSMHVEITDVTERFNVVSVMGPQTAALLDRLNSDVFPLTAQPFGAIKEFDLDGSSVRAMHVSYIGEPGWELHVPATDAPRIYETILNLGAQFGIRQVGNHAISAMRIEKGFRAFGHEISPAETPFEAGLEFAINWEKEFLGKTALADLKDQPLRQRLVSFRLLDGRVHLWGNEPIIWNGRVAGRTSSAGFSPTLGASIAMGYVQALDGSITEDRLRASDFAIEQTGRRYPALASLRAPLEIVSDDAK